MKVLMLVNWKIQYSSEKPEDKQPPDYFINGERYWFFRYFKEFPQVDVIDISSWRWLESFEKEKLRFYIWQTVKMIPKLSQYDLIISHGMQSGIVLSLWRKFFKVKAKHIVFDIGSFNSAAETGMALKLMQFASKSIDGIIYHTSSQLNYYDSFFPWLVPKSKFIRFGTDLKFFDPSLLMNCENQGKYILCVGYAKRDWDTLIKAYQQIGCTIPLRLIGHVNELYKSIPGVEQIPFIPVTDLIHQIYNAAFCVLPLDSFNYSYGQMTLLQQMALGKCVLAARVPSLLDYVQDGDTAVFYTPGDADELSKKMRIMVEDSDFCQKIGCAGRQYLLNKCNETIMAKDIESYLMRVLRG